MEILTAAGFYWTMQYSNNIVKCVCYFSLSFFSDSFLASRLIFSVVFVLHTWLICRATGTNATSFISDHLLIIFNCFLFLNEQKKTLKKKRKKNLKTLAFVNLTKIKMYEAEPYDIIIPPLSVLD